MAMTDPRQTIAAALADFESRPLAEAVRHLLEVPGYSSDRTISVSSPSEFCGQFDPEGQLDHPFALTPDGKRATDNADNAEKE